MCIKKKLFPISNQGFCSTAGGLSAANNEYYTELQNRVPAVTDDHVLNAYKAEMGGYGMASFFYICAFVLFFSAGLYISPLVCGSANERKIIKDPQDLESSGFVPTAITQPADPVKV